MQWLVQSYQRRALRRAVRHAYTAFARAHPNWVAALFDEHFVNTHLLPTLQMAAERGDKVTPMQVAELWARQVSMLPSLRQKHTARMIPAATRFLCMVADNLAESQFNPSAQTLVETAVG
jgi:hypothetical protein